MQKFPEAPDRKRGNAYVKKWNHLDKRILDSFSSDQLSDNT